ncbi:MAG: hypothetical protein ACP5PV_05000 [Methanothrix sp.]
MFDLVWMRPNIKINLLIAALNKRREKAACEIDWPTFARLKLCAPGSEGTIPQLCTLSLASLLSPLNSPEDLIQCQIKHMRALSGVVAPAQVKALKESDCIRPRASARASIPILLISSALLKSALEDI